MLFCTGLLFCALFHEGAILYPQEPAQISGFQAVRFEHSPGFSHYVAMCRTPKDFSAKIPPIGLPLTVTEFAVCWYVTASRVRSGGKDEPSPEVDGKLVISAHHVRFVPRNGQFSDLYADLPPDRVELKRDPGGDGSATLGTKDFVYRFRFAKLCPSCAPGTPVPPGLNPALLDQEFGLLDTSLKQFDPTWRRIYHLSAGTHAESQQRNQAVASTGSVPVRPSAQQSPTVTSNPSAPAVPNSTATTSVKPGAGTVPKTASVAVVKPAAASVTETRRPAANTVKIPPGAAAGMLVKKVEPVYPLEAKVVRLEGTVVLRAVIDTTGEVSSVNAISGPPLLESAAVDAVKQWQYRPYAVNGQPVEVETTIQVVFALDGSQLANKPQKHP
jgi:TonB family protein